MTVVWKAPARQIGDWVEDGAGQKTAKLKKSFKARLLFPEAGDHEQLTNHARPHRIHGAFSRSLSRTSRRLAIAVATVATRISPVSTIQPSPGIGLGGRLNAARALMRNDHAKRDARAARPMAWNGSGVAPSVFRTMAR